MKRQKNEDILLAGVVILYNPNIDTLYNIESYIDFLEKLYVVDNGGGDIVIQNLYKYENVNIIKHKGNMGIAFSLNEVLKECEGKFTHLLTMDQDSKFTDGSMKNYCDELRNFCWTKTLGVSPKIIDFTIDSLFLVNVKWKKTISLITSGNIISVTNAISIGGFAEELFIDEVDSEFCFRGKESGLDCYVCDSGIYLMHKLGDKKKRFILFRTFSAMNHNHIRKYYIVRNRLYVYSKYHRMNELIFFKRYIKHIFYIVLGVLFIEENKIQKLKYMLKGVQDFYKNKMGKLIE